MSRDDYIRKVLKFKVNMIYTLLDKSEIRRVEPTEVNGDLKCYLQRLNHYRIKVSSFEEHCFEREICDYRHNYQPRTSKRVKKIDSFDLIKFNNAICFGDGAIETANKKIYLSHMLNKSIFYPLDKIRFVGFEPLIKNRLGLELLGDGYVKLNDNINNYSYTNETVLLMTRLKDNSYSHFVWDTIPLLAYRDFLRKELGEDVKILIPYESISSFKLEFLRKLGVKESDLIIKPLSTSMLFKSIYVGSPTSTNNVWISDFSLPVLTSLRLEKKKTNKKNLYYFDRNDERKGIRKIVNESKIVDICKKYGLEIKTPGKMTLAEKQEVFSQADLIVGQYGGGMQNHFLCNPKTHILLLQSEKFFREIHYNTATRLNHYVTSIIGPALSTGNNSDFSIDDAVFERELVKILGKM